MKSKEFLRQIRKSAGLIESLKAQYEQLQLDAMFKSSGNDSPKVSSSGSGDRMAEKAIKAVELKDTVVQMMNDATAKKLEALETIKLMSDIRQQELLIDYYVNNLSWQEVADKMGYDVRWIYVLHGKALQEFERIHFNSF